MRSSTDDERAAFLPSQPSAPLSTPLPLLYSHDDGPDTVLSANDEDGLLSKAEHRTRRRRFCGLRRLVSGICSRRRSKRRCFWLVLKFVFGFIFSLVVFTPILAPSYLHPPAHYRHLAGQCESRSNAAGNAKGDSSGNDPGRVSGCANPLHEKVFIGVSLYDRDGHLADGNWGNALVDLVYLLGPDNVFVSIYENDSGHRGAVALEHLKRLLPCRNSVVYEEHVPFELFPNVTMPDGSVRTKRLAYLSEMRNRALRPLDTLGGVDSIKFDKILFLNDVAFEPIDAAQLLFSTNVDASGRAQYLSACALDWKHPYLFYDVYAQRDAEGFSNGIPLFPIFSNAGNGHSRSDMLAQKDAVRVKSCWGGMVAMKAEYIQNLDTALPRPDFQDIGSHVINPAEPTGVVSPVRFRYEPEIYFDACECCLFQADVSQAARIAGAPKEETGVFVNPYIRVAYKWETLKTIRVVQYWERLFAIPQAIVTYFTSLPTHNPHRLVKEGDTFVEEVWNNVSNAWRMETRTGRNGLFCGVREMQLIHQGPREGDKNWANAAIPPGQALDFPT